MRPRKKPMRPAFVATVATAAATLIACGGKAEDSGITPVITNPPPVATCDDNTQAGDTCRSGEGSICSVAAGTLVCSGGRWFRQEVSTNPPPAYLLCAPKTREGDPCSEQSYCEMTDTCPSRPATAPSQKAFSCVGGKWTRSSASYIVACPAQRPVDGTSCASCAGSWPAQCEYTPSCPSTARCSEKTGLWEVSILACNPPPPDAGVDGG
jgi:hypothetical protein